jgi:hypothetical protein
MFDIAGSITNGSEQRKPFAFGLTGQGALVFAQTG